MAEVQETEAPRPPGPLPGGEKSIAGKWFVIAVLLFAVTMTVVRVAQAQPHRELREAAAGIQLAVERFAVESDGSYPHKIEQIVERGFIAEWPDNPYGPGPLKPLQPGAPAEPGGFVYVGHGTNISIGDNSHAGRTVQTTEYDKYLLAFYGPRRSKARAADAQQAARQYLGFNAQLQKMPPTAGQPATGGINPLATTGIDWERVELLVVGGENVNWMEPGAKVRRGAAAMKDNFKRWWLGQ